MCFILPATAWNYRIEYGSFPLTEDDRESHSFLYKQEAQVYNAPPLNFEDFL